MVSARFQRITLEDLQAHFREAVALTSAIAAPQTFRNHLFALLLLKHLNDLFEEHSEKILQAALKQGKTRSQAEALAHDADEHRFFVPPDARWPVLLGAEESPGAQIERACLELERHNPGLLRGVLTALRFESFETGASRDHLWWKLLLHLDKLPLGREHLASPGILGEASTFLLAHLAAQTSKRAAAETSSPQMMQLLAELLRPEAAMRICDPVCGSGSALIACAEYLQRRGRNPQNLSLFGQEIDAENRALCVMNLLLHDLSDARIALGSTISNPMRDDAGALMQFDLVIAEPPVSMGSWEYEAAAQAADGRFAAGLPPPRHGELAFVQHIAATLNAEGRAAVVVPAGVLFRGGSEKQIRAELLRADLIEAVIALPEGALQGRKAAAAILILNRAKRPQRRERVLFVDAKRVLASAAHSSLDETARLKLVALYLSFGEQYALAHTLELLSQELALQDHVMTGLQNWAAAQPAKWATAVADLETIAKQNDCNINLGRYVGGADDYEIWNVRELLSSLPELDRQTLAAQQEMNNLLEALGYRLE